MPRAKKYTKDEVIALLQQSEGRLSPVTHQGGHTLEKHVLIGDQQLTDRLIPTLGPANSNRPILVDPSGNVVSKALHVEIWKETHVGLSTKQAKKDYEALFEGDAVAKAGAFADLQQAGVLGKFALNSTVGQAELAKLDDGTNDRITIDYSVDMLHNVEGEWRMRFVCKGNDIPAMVPFTKVFMLVDKLDPEGIHIQTFFPVA
jgi:hypothetical protein